MEAGTYAIGEWLFSSSANELRQTGGSEDGAQRRKLEDRASRTLELLCRRRGAVVSQDEILTEVWNGRTISANSIPVVIRDLRQALGDDAREPRHIETVAKRGYRLLEEAELRVGASATDHRVAGLRRFAAGTVIAAVLALALVNLGTAEPPMPPSEPLIVSQLIDATGSAEYRPLARASQEVIIAAAQRMSGVEVFSDAADPKPGGSFTLASRLIIWNGRPMVMMSAQDDRGAVIWTGMTSGEERLIPNEVSVALRELEAAIRQ